MGVITKMLYRGEDLDLAPFRNLFLDMEENIHIHYRDLRIELSRAEFEEICNTFSKQSKELLAIIYQRNYQDGKLPNSNQEDTRIWTESRLNHPVKYHPQRISIEECTDGYHVHLRNYKFLLSKADFNVFYHCIKNMDLDAPYASSRKDILQLFADNDMDFVVNKEDEDSNTAYVLAANYHISKIRTICEKIGMTREIEGNKYIFKKGDTSIVVSSVAKDDLLSLQKMRSTENVLPLVAFLLQQNNINKDVLNHIKCQALDLFCYYSQCLTNQSKLPDVDLNYQHWNFDKQEQSIIFPFKLASVACDVKYLNSSVQNWNFFQKEHDLFFIKPSKIKFDAILQEKTREKIFAQIRNSIAKVPGVAKIYLMGSIVRKEMGLYKSPFVHSGWAKLGSDVDILIEMRDKNTEVPDSWEFVNVSSSNSCDIYHLTEEKLNDEYGYQEEFPHISFFHHLIDAYVYFPGKGDFSKKEAFLKKFSGKLFFAANANGEEITEDDVPDPWQTNKKESAEKKALINDEKLNAEKLNSEKNIDEIESVKKLLFDEYGINCFNLNKLRVATENALYFFSDENQDYVLKIYKVSGNYKSIRLLEHTEYEAAFIKKLMHTDLKLAHIRANHHSKQVVLLDKFPAVLYHFQHGRIYKYPDPQYPINKATQVLSQLHQIQLDQALELSQAFSFDDVFNLWYPEFYRFKGEVEKDAELTHDFELLDQVYRQLSDLYKNINSNQHIPCIHNHGDVTPRNFVIENDAATVIDFQNAFYGPRVLDVIDGAYEFSFGGKPPGVDDFTRFNAFIEAYQLHSELNAHELAILNDVIKVCGLIKFVKEVRMIKGATNKNNLRRTRALSLSQFLIKRYQL